MLIKLLNLFLLFVLLYGRVYSLKYGKERKINLLLKMVKWNLNQNKFTLFSYLNDYCIIKTIRPGF